MGAFAVLFPAAIGILDPATRNPLTGGNPTNGTGWYGTNVDAGTDGTTDTDLCECLKLGSTTFFYKDPAIAPNDIEIEFEFDQNTPIFVLDGAPAISYNSLPGGIIFDTAILDIIAIQSGDSIPAIEIESDGTTVTNPGVDTVQGTFDLCAGGAISPTDLIGIRVKVKWNNVAASVGNALARVFNFDGSGLIVGTFIINGLEYNLETPSEPVSEDDPITATSPTVDGIDYTLVDSVTIVYPGGSKVVPEIDWITIETNLFTFLMPSFGGDTPPVITIEITSTQFSGSIELGSLITIYFTSASGLYRLVPDARHDELYIEDEPGATITVKIPNPSFRTGFVGS